LVDNAATSEVITTAATGTLTIGGTMSGTTLTAGTHTGAALASISLAGNINYQASALANSVLAVNGGQDNNTVNLTVTAGNTSTNNLLNFITLGNGNNNINLSAMTTTGARMAVTLGTGQSTVSLGASGYNVTFGTHSASVPDTLNISAVTAGSANLQTVTAGWNLSNSSTTGDKLNFSVGGIGGVNTIRGVTVAGADNSAVTAGTTPVLANFPIAVGGTMPVGNIFSFGSTVYNRSSLETYVKAQAPTFTTTGTTAAAFLGLATYSDGVHVELIQIGNAANLAGATVIDLVDLVGTSITNTITSVNANGFGFIA